MTLIIRSLGPKDSFGEMFSKGIVLWRHVKLDEFHGAQLTPFQWEKNERPDRTPASEYMARVKINGAGIYEPQVEPFLTDEGDYNTGFILFVREQPPEKWTHIVVSGPTNALRNSSVENRGGALFGNLAEPYDLRSYLEWRQCMWSRLFGSGMALPIEEVARISNANWVSGHRSCEPRLLLVPDSNGYYCYTRLTIGGDVS